MKKKPATTKKKAKPPAKEAPAAKKAPAAAQALHRKALRHNWDDGERALQRIVDNPQCDYGTALAIYWMGAPGYDQRFVTRAEVDTWRRETFSFLRKLEKRLLARDFATADILFNPRFDRTTVSAQGHDWTAEYADTPKRRPIPAALMEPSRLDPAWEARGRVAIANTANRLT